MPAYDPETEELFHVDGDAPDPTGQIRKRGMAQEMRLTQTAMGHPLIRYGDHIIEADVYKIADEPMMVHLICPRCRNAIRITEDRKEIDYDPNAGDPRQGGRLSIEPFECTWELSAERQNFGVGLCRWRVGIQDNVAKDA
jgi:hypothetical protein